MLRVLGTGTLFAERSGEGPVQVVAFHGWGRSRKDFRDALEGISALAVDLPGFGASPPPALAWGTMEYAEAVAPALDEATAPVVILGHSFGGRIAVRLALAHPERVRALVLVGTPLIRRAPARPPARFRVLRALRRLGLVSERRMEAARRRHGSRDYRNASGVMRQTLVRVISESYESELGRLSCPVTLVWGSADAEVPVEVARVASSLIPRSRLVVVPGAGHNVPRERPDAVRQAVRDALAQ